MAPPIDQQEKKENVGVLDYEEIVEIAGKIVGTHPEF
jgi:hypothetical protein